MPVAYSKPCHISTMMRHVENPGIVRTVYFDIFTYILENSAILSHVQVNVQACSSTLWNIKAY